MSINRGPFNALVDDSGTGTTGTPWNKQAIKDVILDPVDAALAAGPLTKLLAGTGTNATPTPDNLLVIPIPALGVNDTVVITVQAVLGAGGATPVILDILPVGNGVTVYEELVLTGTTGAGDLMPNTIGFFQVLLQPMPTTGASTRYLAYGSFSIGTSQARGTAPFGRLSTVNLVSPIGSGNTLFLRQMSGIAAGASLAWSCAVHLLKG